MLASNQTEAHSKVVDGKTELEHVMPAKEELQIDVLDVKGTVGEMRPFATKRRTEFSLPQANLPPERSKGKHQLDYSNSVLIEVSPTLSV